MWISASVLMVKSKAPEVPEVLPEGEANAKKLEVISFLRGQLKYRTNSDCNDGHIEGIIR